MRIKNYLLFGLVFIFLISSVLSLTPETNGKHYWNFSDLKDFWGTANLTNNGAVPSITDYPVFNITKYNSSPNSFDLSGTDDYFTTADSADWDMTNTTEKTISIWIKHDVAAGDMLFRQLESGTKTWLLGLTATNKVNFYIYNGAYLAGYPLQWDTKNISVGSWTHIVFVKNRTNHILYVDGKSYGNKTAAGSSTFASPLYIGAYLAGTDDFDGKMDFIKIYNTSLNSTQVRNLYNFGSIVAVVANNSILAKNQYDNSTINSFSVLIKNGTTTRSYYTSIGNISKILPTDKRKYNITFYNWTGFNRTYYNYNFSLSDDLIGKLDSTNITIEFRNYKNNLLINYRTINLIDNNYSITSSTTNGILNFKPRYGNNIKFTTGNNIFYLDLSIRDISTYTIYLNESTYPYWRQDLNTTKVWLNTSTFTGAKTFYITNLTGYAQNINRVFPFGDDFSSGSLNTSKWTATNVGTFTVTYSGGVLDIISTLTAGHKYVLTGKMNFTYPYSIYNLEKLNHADENYPIMGAGFNMPIASASLPNNGFFVSYNYPGASTDQLNGITRIGGVTDMNTLFAITDNVWYENRLYRNSTQKNKWYVNNSLKATGTTSLSTSLAPTISVFNHDSNPSGATSEVWYSAIWVNKDVTTEPTVTKTYLGNNVWKVVINNTGSVDLTNHASLITGINITGDLYITESPIYFMVTASDAVSGAEITSFNATLSNSIINYTFSTTDGLLITNLSIDSGDYNITVRSSTHATDTFENIDSVIGIYNAELYKKNSIVIQTYWLNGTRLDNVFNVYFTNINASTITSSVTNTTGFLEETSLATAYYKIEVVNSNFNSRFFYVDLLYGSSVQINVYLTNSTNGEEKTFYTKDSILLTPLPSTLLTFTYLVGGSWVNVGQILSDGLGFGSIFLENSRTYKLLVEEANHTTKLMSLNTISSISSYDILLDPVSSLDFVEFYDLFNYYILPSGTERLKRGIVSFNITTSSPNSYIQWFAVYYNSSNLSNVTGSPAGGTAVLNLNTSKLPEYFKVSYLIKLNNYDVINKTINYQVTQSNVTGSFVDIKEDDPFTTDKNRGIFASLIIVMIVLLVSKLFDIDKPDGSKSLNALALVIPIIFFMFIGFIDGIIGGMVCTLLVFTLIPKGD